jgi:predicted ribosome quality control (RQC) complex YloA/Tae2 family protein
MTEFSTDEDLIKYAWPQDVWFHVDKLSSAHVYLRMPEGMTWDKIPEEALVDCAQLVKANSIEGKNFFYSSSFGFVLRIRSRKQER